MSAADSGPSLFRSLVASTMLGLCLHAEWMLMAALWGLVSIGYLVAFVLHLLDVLKQRKERAK